MVYYYRGHGIIRYLTRAEWHQDITGPIHSIIRVYLKEIKVLI